MKLKNLAFILIAICAISCSTPEMVEPKATEVTSEIQFVNKQNVGFSLDENSIKNLTANLLFVSKGKVQKVTNFYALVKQSHDNYKLKANSISDKAAFDGATVSVDNSSWAVQGIEAKIVDSKTLEISAGLKAGTYYFYSKDSVTSDGSVPNKQNPDYNPKDLKNKFTSAIETWDYIVVKSGIDIGEKTYVTRSSGTKITGVFKQKMIAQYGVGADNEFGENTTQNTTGAPHQRADGFWVLDPNTPIAEYTSGNQLTNIERTSETEYKQWITEVYSGAWRLVYRGTVKFDADKNTLKIQFSGETIDSTASEYTFISETTTPAEHFATVRFK